MSWITPGEFQLIKKTNRHYVLRRNNHGNTEINVPRHIVTKAQAKIWLKQNPTRVKNPTKFKPKRAPPKIGQAFMVSNWSTVFGRQPPGPNGPSPKYPPLPPNWKPANSPPYGPRNSPKLNMSVANFKKSLVNLRPIGVGRQGKAYLASQKSGAKFVIKIMPFDRASENRKEFQPADVEYENQRVCMNLAPDGVVRVFKRLRALDFVSPANIQNIKNSPEVKKKYDFSKQNIIVMEYCDGGTLGSWLRTAKVSDALFKKIITQVLDTLMLIRKKYPHFNHNDLHFENIFVSSKRGFLIGDFGWSRLKENGTNPAVNTANGTETSSYWGVGPRTDPRYDIHMFLSEMRDWITARATSKALKTLQFLDRIIPQGYRGKSNSYVKEGRLKYNLKYPGLPELSEILNDPFLKGGVRASITSPMLKEARGRLRRASVVAGRRRGRVTSPMLREARAKLKRVKGYTNAELRALSAKDFLALSPATKARAKVLRAAAKPSPPKAKRAVAVNLTARKVTSVMPSLPARPKAVIPRAVLKSNKLNRLINKIWKNQNKIANESYNNAWSRARKKALNQIENRIARGLEAFSPSPPKPASPPKPKPKNKSPPKPKAKAKPKNRSARNNLGMKLSPSSGRVKLKAPNSGRLVYANGATISLQYLKNLAARYNVNIKGLRTKANIARKIFGN